MPQSNEDLRTHGVKPPPIPPPVSGKRPLPPPLPSTRSSSPIPPPLASRSQRTPVNEQPFNEQPVNDDMSGGPLRHALTATACVASCMFLVLAVAIACAPTSTGLRNLAANHLLNHSLTRLSQAETGEPILAAAHADASSSKTESNLAQFDAGETFKAYQTTYPVRIGYAPDSAQHRPPQTQDPPAQSETVEDVADAFVSAAPSEIDDLPGESDGPVDKSEPMETSSSDVSTASEIAIPDFVDPALVAKLAEHSDASAPVVCRSQRHGTLIDWAESPAEAQEQARAQGKMVMLILVSGNFAKEEFT